MKLSDFDYDLPRTLIAGHPSFHRDDSRLLALERATGNIEDDRFGELERYLRPGDCMVLNDSRVIPARLFGKRPTGGQTEIFLIEPIDEESRRWKALVRPGRKLQPGSQVILTPHEGIETNPVSVAIEEELAGGRRIIRFETETTMHSILRRFGHVPLPPYILAARRRELEEAGVAPLSATDELLSRRQDPYENLDGPDDLERYQTVYADRAGSVAAPTAGLHFTRELLGRIQNMGVEVRHVTLHVGPGTFEPVKTDRIELHPMHSERYEITEEDAEAIEGARIDPVRRIVAVGTTVVRTLEACVKRKGRVEPGSFVTDILIAPEFEFRAIDALITNFHLPRSTLLMLVSAFAGHEFMMEAYAEAIGRKYRFYSYGDAMLIH